jgi:DNA-binding transcriptional LysR family regulator
VDKLKAMNTFVRVAEGGSLTAAAKALDLSLPAVVRSLAGLEAELGVRLVNRTTRRLGLTAEGREYLGRCRTVLAAVEDAEAALDVGDVEPRGELSITAPVAFGQRYVAPAVTRFVQRHPKVHASVELHDHVVSLHDERIDIGVRIGVLQDSSLVAWRIGSVRRVVVASPAYLRRHGTPRHPRALADVNCVRFRGSRTPWWVFHEGGETLDVSIRGNLEFNHVAPAADACVAGAGFGMFISYQVADLVAAGRLRIVLEAFEPPQRPIHVVVPHGRLLPRRTAAMVEWLRREVPRALELARRINATR